jgi:hypothetical protein
MPLDVCLTRGAWLKLAFAVALVLAAGAAYRWTAGRFNLRWLATHPADTLALVKQDAAAPTHSVASRVREFGSDVERRLSADFQRTGIAFPPERLALLGFKEEKQLAVYVAGAVGTWRFLRAYPILAASGGPGPKLRQGDLQVPEGLYRIASLNPNSRFHVSLRVDYPNAADRHQAAVDERDQLGGDIMIHGSAVSVGCLAMGDEAAEDVFILAARTGLEHITVVLSPVDFRKRDLPEGYEPAPWVRARYESIREALKAYPLP